jgi:hypothetical protein
VAVLRGGVVGESREGPESLRTISVGKVAPRLVFVVSRRPFVTKSLCILLDLIPQK